MSIDMNNQVIFDRRMDDGTILSSNKPEEIWSDWLPNERWLFVAPHDDDIVCGCGITFLAARACGIETFAGIVTNGRMGYCRTEHRISIACIRKQECIDSFGQMGLPQSNIYFLNFDDGSLYQNAGRRFAADIPGPTIGGASGLQNSFTWLLRQVRPTRLFVPSITDIHSDHQLTNSEMMISVFHAQGNIWPELGEPMEMIPHLYEYATYSNFRTPPTIRVRVSDDLFEKKINALLAYRSQEQIGMMIDLQRKVGPKEFIREVRFDIFQPEECEKLFQEKKC